MEEKKKKKSYLGLILRLLMAAAGIGFIVYFTNWSDTVDPATGNVVEEGIFTILGKAEVSKLFLALGIVGLIFPIQTLRWWMLLHARGLKVSLWQCFKLLMVGTFFNFCMPGTTGGDVIKAYYAAKYSHRRTDSVMSIIIDRIVGLLGLMVLAGLAGLTMISEPKVQKMMMFVWTVLGGVIIFSFFYFSRRVRQKIGLERLYMKLPGSALWTKIDEAASAYSDRKGTVAVTVILSVGVFICLSTSTALSGYAIGFDRPLMLLLTVIPLLFLAGALPLSYQGLGVMEGLAVPLLSLTPQSPEFTQVVAMLLLIRLYQIAYGVIGSVFLMTGDIHMHPEAEDEAVAEADKAADLISAEESSEHAHASMAAS